ncbi:MAG: histidine phosphatase family protein [Deltaproteobacteria bacterium]|nr:histidine phosphatase family protein [Deltaproteobacteria bacterium]
MILYIVRHGNTFGDDQEGGKRVFMAGCNQNIPLVASGRAQARAFAQYLEKVASHPTAIYASHLLRTWEFASIIREYFFNQHKFEISLYRDERLLELDYGDWAGLTTDGEHNEIIAKFGLDAWQAWQQQRVFHNFPPHNWRITEIEVKNNIIGFTNDIIERYNDNDVVIAVGSQGSLYYFNALLDAQMQNLQVTERLRIKTGNFCKLVYDTGYWRLIEWNTAVH